MSNELHKDVLIILNSEFQKADRESNTQPSRVRFTSDTLDSLRENIASANYTKLVEGINDNARAIINKIAAEEKALIEKEGELKKAAPVVAKTSAVTGKAPVATQTLIDSTTIIEALSKSEIARPRLERNNAEVVPFNVLMGGKQIITKDKGKAPRALSVRSYFKTIYSSIYKNLSADMAVKDVSNLVPWQDVFGTYDGLKVEQPKAPRSEKKQELVKPNEDVLTSRRITQEDMNARKTIAQIGTELKEVRVQLKNIGNNSQFEAYLKRKENELLKMFNEITGVNLNLGFTHDDKKDNKIPETPFQQLIGNIVGSANLDQRPYEEKEASVQDYYANPAVIATIDRQNEEQMLHSLNDMGNLREILTAESEYNRLRAAESTAVDVLDVFSEEKIPFVLEVGQSPESLIKPQSTKTEETNMQTLAREQASQIHGDAILFDGAHEAAVMLFEQAKEANTLQTSARQEASRIHEDAILFDDAHEAAVMLFEQAKETGKLQKSAHEQALMIQELNNQKTLDKLADFPKNKYTTTDINDRYAVQNTGPKALKLSRNLYSGIYRRVKKEESPNNSSYNPFSENLISLTSLKSQLEDLNLGGIQDESPISYGKVA